MVKREINFKSISCKQFILILLVAYVVAYLIVDGVEKYTVKNEYEKAKSEYYYKEWLKWQ